MAKNVDTGGLNPKQRRFVEEYLIDLNATQAAIRAGYSRKTASIQGHELLRNPKVESAVAAAQEKRSARTEITADRVLQEIATLAYSNLAKVVKVDQYGRILVHTLDELPPEVQRCIESIKQVTAEIPDGEGGTVERVQLSVKLHSKVAALRMLMDHLGMDAPKQQQLSGPDGKPIQTEHSGKVEHGMTKETARIMKLKFLGISEKVLERGRRKRAEEPAEE